MNDGTNHPVFPNPLGTENPENSGETTPQSLLDEKQFQNVLITREGEPDCIPLSTNINLKCKKRMLYFPMDFGELTIDGLIDTGALSSAIPEMDLRKIRLLSPQSVIREGPPPNFQIMVANGQLETPKSTIELKFEVGDIEFHEIFIVMEHLTGPIIGLMFLQRNHTVLDMRQGILNFPFFSMQLKTADHKYSNVLEPILNPIEITIPPNNKVLIRTNSLLYPENAVTGILQPSDLLHEEGDITFCPALVTLNDGNILIPVNNFTDHPYKLKKGLHIANFSVMTPEQMKYVKPVDPASTWHLLQNDQEQAAHYVSSLIKTNRNPQNSENYWFPTPENPGNPEEHTPIQKRILRELQALQDLETLDPTTDAESRAKFLETFDWKDSTLTPEEKEKIEDLLVEFHDIFARHRFDIGMNEEFKVKLTPKDDSPAYSQSLPAPINLKEDILVELAMLHKYGIITTLPFSKYASPIFAQKKPNGKLRLLVDLRKINNLISDDYINNNHPVSTLVDAAQHLAGKKLFCKLDCSQAYHCLPMADQRSIEMLAFNFASRTFAYRRLAQGLSRSLSAFSSFMREYLDKVIKADQCAQYVDDIGIAANDVDHLMTNLRATFKCIQEAGLKLTMHKCHFGAKEIDFLGRTITPQGVKPQKQNVQNFLEKTKFPKSKKALQRYLGFLNYYRNYVPRLSERLAPFYKMLKSDEKVLVSKELVQQFEEINRALDKSCDLALQQPIPNKQIALMTDASFGAAGYAVLIEDDPNQKFTSLRKSYAPVAYGSKTFTPAQIKMSIYAKEFLAIYFAFKEFGHIFWGAPKPVIILTDNKAVTRFFQTKIIPPALWNACDYVIQFNFVIAHIPGAQNTAADYLSRLEADPKDKLIMKIREDVQTLPIEINVQSAGVSQEEQIFYTNDDDDKGTAFTSTIIAEVTQILGITLKCATTKHPQTIGKLERTHASLKTNLKMACGEYRRQWHKYLPLAVLNYNTSYHASIGCEPTRVFHGRIPHNILDHKLANNPNEQINPTTEFAEEIQNRTKILIDKTKQNIMQSYIKYKEYYDRKAKAAPLKEKEYCFVLQPKADNQGSKIPFRDYRWVGPFVVQKVLPNENYIVRRINTNKTQILHRIRLKRFVPNQPLEDNFREQQLQPDEEIIIPQDDLYIITWETDFGEQLITRGSATIPTSLPNAEQPNAAETNTNDVDENEADYIITREELNNDNAAHNRNERLDDDVTKRNEATAVTENNKSDWPNPAVSPKNQEKSLPSTASGPKNDEIFSERNSLNENDANISPNRGDDIIVPEISENDARNESLSPRGGKYNLRPNPNPNYSEDFRY